MITKRLATLQLALLGGFGSVFLLPKDVRVQPAAVDLSLPQYVGDWKGDDQPITQGERDSLGQDTQFARKVYELGDDKIFVSVVLSGPDMNTSIHRPERCLPAQGWTIVQTSTAPISTSNGTLAVTRLRNVRSVPTSTGQPANIRSLDYYWFVGHSDVTPSHFERTWIDIRDRVLHGRNQQWAYITVMAAVSKDFRVFGRDEQQTDDLLRKFIGELAPRLHRPTVALAN
jgi:EpsI family protein